MWSRFASSRKTRMWRVGPHEVHGQVPDETRRVVYLPLCKRVSSADSVATQTGVTRQTMRRNGGRTALAAGLFAQHDGALSWYHSRHDLGRGRYLSICRGPDAFSEGRGICEDGVTRMRR